MMLFLLAKVVGDVIARSSNYFLVVPKLRNTNLSIWSGLWIANPR